MDVASTPMAIPVLPREDILSQSRADQLEALVKELITWQIETPRDLIMFCQKVSRHPDPALVKLERASLRDARFKYEQFFEVELYQVIPLRFPALIAELNTPAEPFGAQRVKQEAHTLKDRCERALSKISQLRRIWDLIGLPLDKRGASEFKKERMWGATALQRRSPAAATYSLVSHVELMKRHLRHGTSLLNKFQEFWDLYIKGIEDVNVDLCPPGLDGEWTPPDMFRGVHARQDDIRSGLSSCDPHTFPPHTDFLKHP